MTVHIYFDLLYFDGTAETSAGSAFSSNCLCQPPFASPLLLQAFSLPLAISIMTHATFAS